MTRIIISLPRLYTRIILIYHIYMIHCILLCLNNKVTLKLLQTLSCPSRLFSQGQNRSDLSMFDGVTGNLSQRVATSHGWNSLPMGLFLLACLPSGDTSYQQGSRQSNMPTSGSVAHNRIRRNCIRLMWCLIV